MPRIRTTRRLKLSCLLIAVAGLITWMAGDSFRSRAASPETAQANASTAGTASGQSIPPGEEPSAAKPLTRANEQERARIGEAYGKLPLSFEANRGQTDRRVRFISRGGGYRLFLTSTEAVLSLGKADTPDVTASSNAVLRMRLAGANAHARAEGLERQPGQTSYFIGRDRKDWHTGVESYAKVSYREVYPGIDLLYYGNQRELEYDFIVSAGASPDRIRLAFTGADKIFIDEAGDLVLRTAAGDVRQHRPSLYQEVNGQRREVAGRYVMKGEQVGFEVGEYDRSRALVIDPVLVYSTYLGGSAATDRGYDIAVDADGNAYVVGITTSSNFPTANPLQPSRNGTSDAYVVKLNPAGSALIYATYLGGSGGEAANGVAVDAAGNAYITGSTASTDFPTANAAQSTSRGGGEGFVAKLNPAGSTLLYSTYWGGAASDFGIGIAVDAGGNAYVTGITESGDFPAVNALQPARRGSPAFRSTNAGVNWSASSTGLNASHVYAWVVNPSTPATVYAATEIGVYKSTDGGNSWNAASAGLPGLPINALVFDRLNPSTLYAGTFTGVYKTTNGGASWTPLAGLPPADFRALAVDPVNTQTIYAATYFGDGPVYKSTDGGATWNLIGNNLTPFDSFNSLAIDPVNPANVYLSNGASLYKSTDGGAQWLRLNVGFDAGIYDIEIDPSTPSTVYVGAGAGLYKSTNGGNWVKTSLTSSDVVTSVIVDPSSPSTVYAGVFTVAGNKNFAKSTDGGNTWSSVPLGFAMGVNAELVLAINPASTSNLYAGSYSGTEALLAKLNPSGTVAYSTYLGGDSSDTGVGVGVDAAGNVYVTGSTSSSNFPMVNALQGPQGAQPFDAFVAKVNPAGSALLYSTYLGGTSGETASAIAVDAAGNAYVTGSTSSTDFPTANPLQAACSSCAGGPGDAFVTKLNPSGSARLYSTYFGGNGSDAGYGIAVDAAGNAYLAGYTDSTNLPTLGGAPQVAKSLSSDAFVTKINAAGQSLIYSTYLGGSGQDVANDIAVGPDGSAYLTGETSSTNFPVAAALQSSRSGSFDGFVARLGPSDSSGASADLSITMTDTPDPATNGQNITYNMTITNNGPSAASGVVVNDSPPLSLASVVSATPSQGTCAQQGASVICNLGQLASGAQASVALVMSLTGFGNVVITNSADVGGNEIDPNTGNNTASQTTTVRQTFTISGQIFSNTGTSLGGVTVTASDGSSTVTAITEPSGNYVLSGLVSGGNYTVTPTLAGYTFSPSVRAFNDLNQSYNGVGFTATPVSAPATVQFSQDIYPVSESAGFINITVTRGGDTSAPATVKYATRDITDANFRCDPATPGQQTGVASRKCDYHIAVGRLRFAAGESTKQFALSLINDVYVEGAEGFTITLSNPTGAALGQNSIASVTITDDDTAGAANPIDNTSFFVRQLYVDLLSREPDPAGWNGWTTRIDQCGQPGQAPPPCDRVTVGGDGFLRSGEFFDRQFFVLRLYRTGLGRILRYDEIADLAYVSGFLTAEQLELNKQELVAEMVLRDEFAGRYNPLSNAGFVPTLVQTAGVSIPQTVQDAWIAALDNNSKTRAQVYREISERQEVSDRYLHEAQVVSAYYGFFTRNPDGAYLNYLQRLDSGEINLADLANAFINAAEYRQRFGQ